MDTATRECPDDSPVNLLPVSVILYISNKCQLTELLRHIMACVQYTHSAVWSSCLCLYCQAEKRFVYLGNLKISKSCTYGPIRRCIRVSRVIILFTFAKTPFSPILVSVIEKPLNHVIHCWDDEKRQSSCYMSLIYFLSWLSFSGGLYVCIV